MITKKNNQTVQRRVLLLYSFTLKLVLFPAVHFPLQYIYQLEGSQGTKDFLCKTTLLCLKQKWIRKVIHIGFTVSLKMLIYCTKIHNDVVSITIIIRKCLNYSRWMYHPDPMPLNPMIPLYRIIQLPGHAQGLAWKFTWS